MQRLFLAALVALCLHLLFFLLPAKHSSKIAPQITGDDTIRIRLAPAPAPTPIPIPIPTQTKPQKKATPVLITQKKRKHRFQPTQEKAPEAIPSVNFETNTTKQPINTPAASSPVVTVKAKPMYHKNPKPVYPSIARRRNWQGTTILLVNVSQRGVAKQVGINKSSGYEILDKSALHSVKQWHFLPGTENGRAVNMEVLVPVHFKLR